MIELPQPRVGAAVIDEDVALGIGRDAHGFAERLAGGNLQEVRHRRVGDFGHILRGGLLLRPEGGGETRRVALGCAKLWSRHETDALPRRVPPSPRPGGFFRNPFPIPPDARSSIRVGHVTVPPRPATPSPRLRPRQARQRRLGRPDAGARRSAATGLAARASHCSVCSGNRRWGTRSRTPTCCLPALAVSPRSPSTRKGNLWAFQRADAGKPQLFKFDPNDKLILQVGQDVIGYQDKAHGMAVDAERQRLDYRRERRHGDEDQSRGQAAADDRRAGTPRGLERSQRTTAALAAGDGRLRSERRCLHRRGSCERESQRHGFR